MKSISLEFAKKYTFWFPAVLNFGFGFLPVLDFSRFRFHTGFGSLKFASKPSVSRFRVKPDQLYYIGILKYSRGPNCRMVPNKSIGRPIFGITSTAIRFYLVKRDLIRP